MHAFVHQRQYRVSSQRQYRGMLVSPYFWVGGALSIMIWVGLGVVVFL